jgi:hypothetical protein
MNFLQNIDPGFIVVVAGCCVGIFLFGGIIGFVLQVLGFGLGILFNVGELFLQIVSGGPIVWCGCFMLLVGLCGCSVFGLLIFQALQSCGTSRAMMICSLFGL